MNAVDLKLTAERELTLEWIASSSNDMIADAALSLVLQIESSKASVKRAYRFPDYHRLSIALTDRSAAPLISYNEEAPALASPPSPLA